MPLVFQLLIYPMLDDRTVTTADPHPYTGEFLWTHDANRFGWTAFLKLLFGRDLERTRPFSHRLRQSGPKESGLERLQRPRPPRGTI